MKILKWVLVVLVVLVLALLAFLAYMGVFSTPTVTEQIIGPYTLVYEEYTGPYSGSGKVIGSVYSALKKDKIETLKGFGIYLNNPNNTAPDQLKSLLGCVLEEKDLGKVRQIKKNYKVMKWEAKDCLVTEFPIRNNLSYMIGPMKVYPLLNKELTAKGYKMGRALELYDMPAMKTLYIFEIKE